jgi:hypothetical protein
MGGDVLQYPAQQPVDLGPSRDENCGKPPASSRRFFHHMKKRSFGHALLARTELK